jgi:hypothetical protein
MTEVATELDPQTHEVVTIAGRPIAMLFSRWLVPTRKLS